MLTLFDLLENIWIPAFTGMTTFSRGLMFNGNYSGVKNNNNLLIMNDFSNYSCLKSNNNLLIMNDFKYFSCFLQSKIGRVARL